MLYEGSTTLLLFLRMIVAAFEFGSVRVDQFRSLALKHAVARAQRQSIAHLDLHIEKESTIQIVFKMGGSVRIWRLRYVLVKCQGHTHHDAYVNIESSVFFPHLFIILSKCSTAVAMNVSAQQTLCLCAGNKPTHKQPGGSHRHHARRSMRSSRIPISYAYKNTTKEGSLDR